MGSNKFHKLDGLLDVLRQELQADPKPSAASLAKKYDCHPTTLTRFLRKYGLGNEIRGNTKHQALYEKIQADLDADPSLTYDVLSKRYGISTGLISRTMRVHYGVGVRRKVVSTQEAARMRQMYQSGLSTPRIAQIMGYSITAVGKHLREDDTTQKRRSDYLARQQGAYAAIQTEGLTYAQAAARFNLSLGRVAGFVEKMQKQEKENANADRVSERHHVDDRHTDRTDADQSASGGDPGGSALGGKDDLRVEEGRQDHRGLGSPDAPEGQTPEQRLRRCG